MKKRGHKPDAQTFTTLLQGFRENVNKTNNAVIRATEVYNSMYAVNSAVRPNIIHTNSVLAVCARGHDMTQIWTIAGRLPDRGPDAPDCITYTTILTAITADARKRALELGEQDGDPAVGDTIFEDAVADGRKLWSDITGRWRRGDLEMDEHLVSAMGRLLMLSKDIQSHQSIFTLVEQAMRLSMFDDRFAKTQANPVAPEDGLEQEDKASEEQDEPGLEVAKLPQEHSSTTLPFRKPSSVFATPGNKTLSMLLQTAASLREIDTGRRYWRLITSQDGPFKVYPDVSAYTDYLRLLRIARASKETLSILQSIPDNLWERLANKGTFIIAMSTCARDRNNPNVFGTATEILDLMQTKLAKYVKHDPSETDGSNRELLVLSPKVLKNYVQIAIDTTHGMNAANLVKQPNGDLDFERDLKKNNAINAVTKLGPSTSNAKRLLKVFVEEYERQLSDSSRTVRVTWLLRKRAEAPEHVAELLGYFQALIAAYDKLLLVNVRLEDEGLGPLAGDFLREANAERRHLNMLVSKTNNVQGIRGAKNSWAPKSTEEDVFGDRVPWETAKVVNELLPPPSTGESASGDTTEVAESVAIESAERAEIRRNIASRHTQITGDSSLRGLSRRQRLEVEKEDRIRSKFPETLLRDRSERHRADSRPNRNADRVRDRWDPSSRTPATEFEKGRPSDYSQLSGLEQLEQAADFGRQERGAKRSRWSNRPPRASDGRDGRPSQRPSSRPRTVLTEGDRRRSAARLRYQVTQGWGSEFTDLAKQRGESTAMELKDLRT